MKWKIASDEPILIKFLYDVFNMPSKYLKQYVFITWQTIDTYSSFKFEDPQVKTESVTKTLEKELGQ